MTFEVEIRMDDGKHVVTRMDMTEWLGLMRDIYCNHMTSIDTEDATVYLITSHIVSISKRK